MSSPTWLLAWTMLNGLPRWSGVLPEGYKEDYTAQQAAQDLTALLALEDIHDMSLAIYVPDRADD